MAKLNRVTDFFRAAADIEADTPITVGATPVEGYLVPRGPKLFPRPYFGVLALAITFAVGFAVLAVLRNNELARVRAHNARLEQALSGTRTVVPVMGWEPSVLSSLRHSSSESTVYKALASELEQRHRAHQLGTLSFQEHLLQLKTGCERLHQSVAHLPLSESGRKWLGGRCIVWRDQFADEVNSVLASGAKSDLDAVANRVDKVVEEIVDSLRAQSAQST
jgi:hypothetical protein